MLLVVWQGSGMMMGMHLLELQVEKTEVFSWSGLLPPEAPPLMRVAGVTLDGVFYPGMVVYGIPVGCTQYVQHMLNEVVEDIASQLESVQELLVGDSQAVWGVLSSSLAHKLDWHISLCYPSGCSTKAGQYLLVSFRNTHQGDYSKK